MPQMHYYKKVFIVSEFNDNIKNKIWQFNIRVLLQLVPKVTIITKHPITHCRGVVFDQPINTQEINNK